MRIVQDKLPLELVADLVKNGYVRGEMSSNGEPKFSDVKWNVEVVTIDMREHEMNKMLSERK